MSYVPQVALHVDVYDCIKVWKWSCGADVYKFVAHCAEIGIHHLYWRLSIVGTFLHHTQIERQMRSNSEHHHIELSHRLDLLKIGVEAAKKYGVKIFPWITMSDEGFAPRLKGQQSAVISYYSNHGWPLKVMSDSLELSDGIPHSEKWFDAPVPLGFESVIPAMEQSQGCDPVNPWNMYTTFARNHPEYLTADRYGFKLGKVMGLSYPQVREYRKLLIREILEYDCDGLCLDFTRWPGEHDTRLFDEDGVNVFGYDEPAITSFFDKFGIDVKDISNSDFRWVQHRCDCGATLFLKELRNMVGQDFPIHTMLFLADNHKEAFLDHETWLEDKLVDKIIPFGFAERYGILNRAVDSPYQPEARRKTYDDWFVKWADETPQASKIEMAVNMGGFSESPTAIYSQQLLTTEKLNRYLEICRQKQMGGLTLYEACHVRSSHMHTIKDFLSSQKTQLYFDPTVKLKIEPTDEIRKCHRALQNRPRLSASN